MFDLTRASAFGKDASWLQARHRQSRGSEDPGAQQEGDPRRRDRCLREKGFDGTSIAEIGRGGTAKANVYYYFKSKETIYQTIGRRPDGEWDKALAHLTPTRARRCARAYIRAKLDFSRRHTAQSQMSPTRRPWGAS